MKTLLLVIAMALTISFSGSASNVSSVSKNQTQNVIVSKTNSSTAMKSGKAKKAHAKIHKHVTTAKKAN
jgi:hypothetical protein